MAIQHRLVPSGAFVAGDTVTGVAAYAYPSSHYATLATRRPEQAACEMIDNANADHTVNPWTLDQRERFWRLLAGADEARTVLASMRPVRATRP